MTKQIEALKLALEALEYISSHYMSLPKIGCMALAAIEEALTEQPAQQQEPFAEVRLNKTGGNAGLSTHIVQLSEGYYPAGTKLYTTPQPAKRKPLTDEEIEEVSKTIERSNFFDCVIPFARAIEAFHGIKEQP